MMWFHQAILDWILILNITMLKRRILFSGILLSSLHEPLPTQNK